MSDVHVKLRSWPSRASFRTNAKCLIVAILLAVPTSVQAQQSANEVERRYDAVSPTGVSYASGSFSYSIPLLKVGNGEFPRSLSFDLSYNSGSDKFPGFAWVDAIDTRTTMTLVDDPYASLPDPDGKPHPGSQTWQFNIIYGHHSQAFEKYGNPLLYLNPFRPSTATGASLRVGTAPSGARYFIYETGDGDILQFRPKDSSVAPDKGDFYLARDGVRQRYNYGTVFSISNNLGWAILYERPTPGTSASATVCAINLTQYYLSGLTACPTGVPRVSYVVATSGAGAGRIASVTETDGGQHQFTYSTRSVSGNTRRALTCVRKPGSAQCDITNTYDNCDTVSGFSYANASQSDYDSIANGSRDRVTRQVFADASEINFTWASQELGCRYNSGVKITDAVSAETILTTDMFGGTVLLAKDPLLRQRTFTYTGANSEFSPSDLLPETVLNAEGDKVEYMYDARGNLTQTRVIAKPGSGLPDTVSSATFPASCTSTVPCNKPSSMTDARGGGTDYTYDPVHWGVLTETGPTVDGVRPVKRHEYAQRYAWLKNAAGGYSPADEPVWLLVRDRTCRTTATVSNGCAGGTSDEVVTDYDYGPNSGPNNLLLRGVAVTSEGVTLRSCYSYDFVGRRVGETKPSANLSACP